MRRFAVPFAALVLTACAQAPRLEPPVVRGPYVSHTETIIVATPLEDYVAWRDRTPLEAVLTGGGGLPSVTSSEGLGGTWPEPGARRLVRLSDDSEARERVLDNDGPARFRYQVWGFTSPAGGLVDHAVGEFRLTAEGPEQTRVQWTYAFRPRSWATGPAVRAFVHFQFRPFMRTALNAMKTGAEGAASGPEDIGGP